MKLDLMLVVAAFVLGTIVAELLGATNLGVALAFGQLTFAAVLVYALVRRP